MFPYHQAPALALSGRRVGKMKDPRCTASHRKRTGVGHDAGSERVGVDVRVDTADLDRTLARVLGGDAGDRRRL